MGFVDMVTGRARMLRKENERDAMCCLDRDRAQKDELVRAHLYERQTLQTRFDELRLSHQGERKLLARDVTQYLRNALRNRKNPKKRFTFSTKAKILDRPPDHKPKFTRRKPLSKPNKEAEITRDKDNAQPRVKPPSQAQKPGPRLAPPGTTGTRANLATPSKKKEELTKKRFTLGKSGDLSKEFKPIVKSPKSKGHDQER